MGFNDPRKFEVSSLWIALDYCCRTERSFSIVLIFLCVRNISTIEIELDRSCFLFYLTSLFCFSDTTIKEGGRKKKKTRNFTCLREKRGEGNFMRGESQESTAQKRVENLRNIEFLGKKLGFLLPPRRIKDGSTLRCYKEHVYVRTGKYIYIYIGRM